MYNGVGLTTPRGSGTSGYVQKNMAFVNKTSSRMKFQKELEVIKANPPKPPKKPNKDILDHEQKRLIEIQLIKFKKRLEADNLPIEEIDKKIKKAREYLHNRLDEAPLLGESTSHSKIFKKFEEIKRFEEAFNIDKSYVPGSGFDFEAIDLKKRMKLEEAAQEKPNENNLEKS